MADARNIQLGPCSVTFIHPDLGSIDLGHTQGGTEVNYKPDVHKTKVDKFGSSTVKRFLVGEELTAETKLAEWTLNVLRTAIPGGTLAGDDAVAVGSVVGKNLSAKAGLLVLHPLANAANNKNDDVGIYKALVTNDLKIEHKANGEKVVPVTFEGEIDETRADGSMLGFIGDSTD